MAVNDANCNSLLQIWKLRFGDKAKLLFRFWAQGLVKILKFRRDFEAEVWSVFCCWCLVEILKLTFDQYLFKIRPKQVTLVKTLNPWVRCAFGNFQSLFDLCFQLILRFWRSSIFFVGSQIDSSAPRFLRHRENFPFRQNSFWEPCHILLTQEFFREKAPPVLDWNHTLDKLLKQQK